MTTRDFAAEVGQRDSGYLRSSVLVLAIAPIALLALGCGQSRSERATLGRDSIASAGDGNQPFQVLVSFLDRSIETAPKGPQTFAGIMSEEEGCWKPFDSFSSYWVADYRVLSVDVDGDSADAVAELVTVAEQTPDTVSAYGSIVTRRIKRDTLAFLLVRETGGWRVCGWARNEWQLGSYGRPDNVVYHPDGATKEGLRALVDSIRASNDR